MNLQLRSLDLAELQAAASYTWSEHWAGEPGTTLAYWDAAPSSLVRLALLACLAAADVVCFFCFCNPLGVLRP
ncbi:hypothetical protein Micbo1qcDRAFT_39339 [Microdochium bolleyi]|uniref:Uncharacterized protein n=1 Tax=Microdochium bolleyi TaxID=196109 RepID=A0A136J9K7_9PEZI|nr:hypothetical protein Micbo1qcDRAFT_39339 [Microdochium bolleyi]